MARQTRSLKKELKSVSLPGPQGQTCEFQPFAECMLERVEYELQAVEQRLNWIRPHLRQADADLTELLEGMEDGAHMNVSDEYWTALRARMERACRAYDALTVWSVLHMNH